MFLHLSVILVTGGFLSKAGAGCLSRRVSVEGGALCPGGGSVQGVSVQGDPRTVKERAVRILLECILVYRKIHNPDLFENILDFVIF